jgi:hypothetical protein
MVTADMQTQVDDSLLWKPTVAECFTHTTEYLTLVGNNGILENPAKLKFFKKILVKVQDLLGRGQAHASHQSSQSGTSPPPLTSRGDYPNSLAPKNDRKTISHLVSLGSI